MRAVLKRDRRAGAMARESAIVFSSLSAFHFLDRILGRFFESFPVQKVRHPEHKGPL